MVFQRSIADQRVKVHIMNKALDRMLKFYSPEEARAAAHGPASATPPPSSMPYERSGGAGGVVQLIQKLISDAESAETAMFTEEMVAQACFEALAKDCSGTIYPSAEVTDGKSQLMEHTMGEKSQTDGLIMDLSVNREAQQVPEGAYGDCWWAWVLDLATFECCLSRGGK